MVLTYLRRVHLWDYYSGMGADSVEDFSRKFPPNLRARGPLEMEPSADEFAWKKASEKVDLRARYFGKLLTDEELAKLDWRDPEQHAKSKMRSFMKEEGEFRFRCLVEDCGKLFKAAEFVEKHLLNKHPNVQTLVDAARAEAEYANAYVRDPCKITVVRESQERPQRPPPRNKPISSRIGGRDEGFEAPPPMPIMLGRCDGRFRLVFLAKTNSSGSRSQNGQKTAARLHGSGCDRTSRRGRYGHQLRLIFCKESHGI